VGVARSLQTELPRRRDAGLITATGIAQPAVRRSDRQDEILDDLESIFLEEGFRRLTLGALAKRLRCSLRSLYQLAPTKEELFLLVLDRMWERVGAEARRVTIEHDDPAVQLEVFMSQGAHIFRATSGDFFADIRSYAPARHLFLTHLEGGTAFLTRLIERGIDSGRFRPVPARLVAKALESLALQTLDRSFLDAVDMDPLDAERELAQLVLRGLSIPEQEAPSNRKRKGTRP